MVFWCFVSLFRGLVMPRKRPLYVQKSSLHTTNIEDYTVRENVKSKTNSLTLPVTFCARDFTGYNMSYK